MSYFLEICTIKIASDWIKVSLKAFPILSIRHSRLLNQLICFGCHFPNFLHVAHWLFKMIPKMMQFFCLTSYTWQATNLDLSLARIESRFKVYLTLHLVIFLNSINIFDCIFRFFTSAYERIPLLPFEKFFMILWYFSIRYWHFLRGEISDILWSFIVDQAHVDGGWSVSATPGFMIFSVGQMSRTDPFYWDIFFLYISFFCLL